VTAPEGGRGRRPHVERRSPWRPAAELRRALEDAPADPGLLARETGRPMRALPDEIAASVITAVEPGLGVPWVAATALRHGAAS
jgi:hypothetical protein